MVVEDDNLTTAVHTCNKGGIIESYISMSRVNDGTSHPNVQGGLSYPTLSQCGDEL